VIVKGGRVIARGHHARAGGPHAEVVALRAAGRRAVGADLYSTLEPCVHQGRTPPCTEAILAARIRRVFFGSVDPNPLVRGKGAAALRRAGVRVAGGILSGPCDALNAPFFRYITSGRPFVTLKAAISADGKLATASGDSRWVSGPESRRQAHRLRDQADAVLVGARTARLDDPRLTTRLPGGRDPVRVVLDSRLSLPPRLKIFRQRSAAPTIVAHCARRERKKGRAELLRCAARAGRVDLADLLGRLAKRGITHLLVEGGAETHAAFLAAGLADRVVLFVAPKIVGGTGLSWVGGGLAGEMKDAVPLEDLQISRSGADLMISARPAFVAKAPRRR
jgi:diaminohydroxyphosphoribosylaminopyrimidine deaminase/5-amino-6-(5-phosphoribosylamino)uracil reductase